MRAPDLARATIPDIHALSTEELASEVDRLGRRLAVLRIRLRESEAELVRVHLDPEASIEEVLGRQAGHDNLARTVAAAEVLLDRKRIQLGATVVYQLKYAQQEEGGGPGNGRPSRHAPTLEREG